MAKIRAFENYTFRYDNWFEINSKAYLSELNAIRQCNIKGKSLEVGVGTGRFAEPLNIKLGIEPSLEMAKIAKKRNIEIISATGENLPFKNQIFDNILLITSICFLDDIKKAFSEAYRVLKGNGFLILGFVDKNSTIGKIYQKIKEKNVFYNQASFVSTDELLNILKYSSFIKQEVFQTLFEPPKEIRSLQPVKKGYGQGSFVVIKAKKE